MNLSIDKAILLKKESTAGTYTAPANTDLVYYNGEPTINYDVNMYDRGLKWNSLTKLPGIPGQRKATVNFDMEINPQLFGDSNYIGVITAILQACALEQTYTAGPPEVYAETLGEGAIMLGNTVSIKYLEGSHEVDIKGARGTLKLTGKVGEPLIASVSFTGLIENIASVSQDYTTFAYAATNPDIVIGGGLTYSLTHDTVSEFELDLGNKLQDVSDIGENYGIGAVLISERTPTFKIDPGEATGSITDIMNALDNQSDQSIIYKTSGTKKYIQISLTNKILPFATKTREGIIVFDLSYGITAVTVDIYTGA